MTVDAARAGFVIEEVQLDLAHRATGRTWRGFVHRGRQLARLRRGLPQPALSRMETAGTIASLYAESTAGDDPDPAFVAQLLDALDARRGGALHVRLAGQRREVGPDRAAHRRPRGGSSTSARSARASARRCDRSSLRDVRRGDRSRSRRRAECSRRTRSSSTSRTARRSCGSTSRTTRSVRPRRRSPRALDGLARERSDPPDVERDAPQFVRRRWDDPPPRRTLNPSTVGGHARRRRRP